jgi:hypothetical protein
MPIIEHKPYEVMTHGERFPFPTFRQMSAFARELERKGHVVLRCQMREGASVARFKHKAWRTR